MWAIILDFSIKGISEDDTTAKEGLLLWCRKKTAGYREIDPPTIQNFTTHWKNRLAFNALIHKHQPHLIDYDSLDKNDAAKNLELAFSVAESLGIPRLLDIEDMLVDKQDERSIMTQVSEYFHCLTAFDVKEVAARRAANFLGFTKKMNALKHDYESSAKALLEWVQSIIDRFATENFGSTLEESVAVSERLRRNGDGAMDKVEFKAALSAMGVSLKNDEALQALLSKVSGGLNQLTLEQWIAYNTELLTDKDTPDQIIQPSTLPTIARGKLEP